MTKWDPVARACTNSAKTGVKLIVGTENVHASMHTFNVASP